MAVTFEQSPEDYLTRLAASDLGRAYKSLVASELDIGPGDSVLDLGCGPGADLPAFAEAVGPAGTVLGLDHDESAVGQARARMAGRTNVTVQLSDIHELDLADRSFDRVHTDRVLQHVDDPGAVLGELTRVLRPGGRAVLAEPDWDSLIIDYPDPAVPVAYRQFITEEVVRNARVGRQLPRLAELAALNVVRIVPVTAVFRNANHADKILGFQRVTERAVDHQYLSADDAQAWLTYLATQPFFASVTLFVTVAEHTT